MLALATWWHIAALKKNPKLISFGLSLKKLDLQYLKQMYVGGLTMHRLTSFTILLETGLDENISAVQVAADKSRMVSKFWMRIIKKT